MPKPRKAVVKIRQTTGQKTLSPEQKKFNRLIEKIDQKKKRLQQWQALAPDFQKKILEEYQPLMQVIAELQTTMVLRLNAFHNRRSFTPSQKDKISYVICEICSALFTHSNADELKPIYKKHSGIECGAEGEGLNDIMAGMMQEIFEEQFGDLGDDFDYTDPEAVAQRVAEKMNGQLDEPEPSEKQAGQQTKRQTAREARRTAAHKAEQEHVSQSIKAIYRQLSTAAHPDRETDPDARARKTEIMKRVNAAYKDKDLLKLLALQLELAQIDQDHINTIAQDRLKAYNKILQDQLEQLRIEIEQAELPYRMSANLAPHQAANPETVVQQLNADIEALQQSIGQLEKELAFLTTVKHMKIWLKNYGMPENAALSGSLFNDEMDDFDFR
ncbi:hypothetical protein SAMN05421690_101070 [Nitrosomonas sp. Nm51]|uniref:J domain-containing protein n=1 Tax=Nitrosomonas sp. Nm51 TaxID=133720 RepID=UPI0008C74373|nr:J domain-containing protein [Nitrosomonas sp. Nm51]SER16390.1 hypothetical protein SAMN05421690_101070 [Nitrosomonas sp. Nm51]